VASNLTRLAQLMAQDRSVPANPKGSCHRGHDMSLPGARKLTHKGDGRYYWLCTACRAIRREKERAEGRARRRARKQRAALEGAQGDVRESEQSVLLDELPPAALDRSPFGVTQRALEAHWQIPVEHWTPWHHRMHTRAMYHMLGWPADGPPRAGAKERVSA
jgi:hypothetical protein